MEPIDYAHWLEKFRALIADHGQFRVKQLHEYVSLMAKRHLTQGEEWELTAAAVAAGARLQKFDGLINHNDPQLYRFPAKRKPRLVSRKNDKHTVDMFTRLTGAQEESFKKRKRA